MLSIWCIYSEGMNLENMVPMWWKFSSSFVQLRCKIKCTLLFQWKSLSTGYLTVLEFYFASSFSKLQIQFTILLKSVSLLFISLKHHISHNPVLGCDKFQRIYILSSMSMSYKRLFKGKVAKIFYQSITIVLWIMTTFSWNI